MTANKDLKVALIGPFPPFRGGIAQYNKQLYDALRPYVQVSTISFKQQYPRWLYPGKSDREPGYKPSKKDDTKYIIDAYSPLSLKKTTDEIIAHSIDVVLVSWWTLFWQPGFAYIARRLRRHGVKVIYICHNVFDHDSNGLVKRVSRTFLGQSDGFIVHASDEEQLLKKMYNKPVLNTRTLPISDSYPKPKGTLKKRGRLELLFFGFIRPYKGLDVLTDALETLNDNEVFLTIVGETWTDRNTFETELNVRKIPNLELHIEYVDEIQAAEFFNRADVLVLPYKSATGSAVASLAYYYKRPILGTRVGGLRDVVLEGKTGWLVEPESPKELANVIRKLDRNSAKETESAITKFCQDNGWDKIAQRFVEFAEKL